MRSFLSQYKNLPLLGSFLILVAVILIVVNKFDITVSDQESKQDKQGQVITDTKKATKKNEKKTKTIEQNQTKFVRCLFHSKNAERCLRREKVPGATGPTGPQGKPGIGVRGPRGRRGPVGPAGPQGLSGRDAVFPFTLQDIIKALPDAIVQACEQANCVGPKGNDGQNATDDQVFAAVVRYCDLHNHCTPVAPPPGPATTPPVDQPPTTTKLIVICTGPGEPDPDCPGTVPVP